MAKVLIKVSRTITGEVSRSFVWLNDRVMPFTNSNEVNVQIYTGVEYGITVYCHGDEGGSVEVAVTRSNGNVIAPLKIELSKDDDVEHASDRFTVQ